MERRFLCFVVRFFSAKLNEDHVAEKYKALEAKKFCSVIQHNYPLEAKI